MTTSRDIITSALEDVGVVGVGQTPLAEDMNYGLVRFNRMLGLVNRQRWLGFTTEDILCMSTGAEVYTLGVNQQFNCPIVDKLQDGNFFRQNTGDFAAGSFNSADFLTGNGQQVDYRLALIEAREDYNKIALKAMPSWPSFIFYSYDNFTSSLGTGTLTAAGAGYTNGTFKNVPLTGGSGGANAIWPAPPVVAQATIVVSGGAVASVLITLAGSGYVIGDVLGVASGALGIGGSGFQWTLTNYGAAFGTVFINPVPTAGQFQIHLLVKTPLATFANLSTVLNTPPEYEEYFEYNLALRFCAKYQIQASPEIAGLARAASAIIRAANNRVPLLELPPGLTSAGARYNIFSDRAS